MKPLLLIIVALMMFGCDLNMSLRDFLPQDHNYGVTYGKIDGELWRCIGGVKYIVSSGKHEYSLTAMLDTNSKVIRCEGGAE